MGWRKIDTPEVITKNYASIARQDVDSMSVPITSVTENRVTVTANDTEANIRASAGFAEPDASGGDAPDEAEKPVTTPVDRDTDGKFKAKTDDAKPDGDPRKSHQAKINAAIAKQRDAERRAEDAERRFAERDAELAALRQPKPAEPTPEPAAKPSTYLEAVQRYQALPDAPKLDDFIAAGGADPYSEHQAAMAAFIADKRLDERDARAEAVRAQRDRDASTRAALDVATQAYPDFETLVRADTTNYSPVVFGLLQREAAADPHLSADLTYHLLTHPEDAAKLASLTDPIAAAREIGRLTASLSSAPSGPETVPTHTTAKPLIKPVRPSLQAAGSSPPEELPFGPKYIAAMNEQDRKARESRRA